MKRFSLPAAILALALPSAGAGESINLSSSDFIARIDETLRDPVASGGFEAAAFHAGVEAAAEAEPVRAGEVEVHFGARPGAGRGATDVGPGGDFEAGGSDAPPAVRPVAAWVRFDTAGTSAETEARATVTVTRGGARGAGVDVGLSRLLADLCSVDPRARDVLEDDGRVELPVQAKF